MIQKNQPLVSIIIVNYNAGQFLLDCVESVFLSNYSNFEVIVVDNVSTDNSHKQCKEKFKQIHLIENKKNLGYWIILNTYCFYKQLGYVTQNLR